MRSRNRRLMEKIKAYAEQYALENAGITPSTREIGDEFSIGRVNAYRYLKAMDELGIISYQNGRICTERIYKIAPIQDMSPSYINAIPAGTPDEIEAQVDEYVSIPSVFVGNQRGRFFLLRVAGESMVDAGIENGDLVIIREELEASPGDIVAALVGGSSSTLKRYRKDEKGAYLWAENKSWNDEKRFYGRDFTIQGVAVKVVKDVT